VNIAAKGHELIKATDRLHGVKTIIYDYAGYIGIEKTRIASGQRIRVRIALKSDQRSMLHEIFDGRLHDLIKIDKALFRDKVEHRFRLVACQF
jgi:alanine dehydrogenase